MLRRLFFLLPDEALAAAFVQDLERAGVEHRRIHAIAGKGRTLEGLPPATVRQQHDMVWRIEHWLWNANLGLFLLAAAGLVLALVAGSFVWAVAALVVMAGTFLGGALFTLRVPDTHLDEFHNALAHGEIVVLVDVPKVRVAEIEDLARLHPEVTPGGVGWTLEALGI